MTVEELRNVLDSLIFGYPKLAQQPVEIQLADPSVGPLAGTVVSAVNTGFDWDQGRVLLLPEKDLYSHK